MNPRKCATSWCRREALAESSMCRDCLNDYLRATRVPEWRKRSLSKDFTRAA